MKTGMTDFLEIADERRTSTRGSNTQTKGKVLSVHSGAGQFLPIVWDNLDYIYCGEPHTHPVMITYDDQLAYEYPVAHCTYYSDEYIYHDSEEEQLKELPEWFGSGFYTAYEDHPFFINDDESSFGSREKDTLQIGLHYVEANDSV